MNEWTNEWKKIIMNKDREKRQVKIKMHEKKTEKPQKENKKEKEETKNTEATKIDKKL